ncbi:hypothetical protein ZOSMA_4G01040 [Zostera marina]|uniref:Uncharacterized protein n=1 Tax=Zostera marina TaxID=29655 RepID=A0A0K9P0S6_ZOSMR|nr:hypothetical protein ZOSMA_4G01040 [Zostera marina]
MISNLQMVVRTKNSSGPTSYKSSSHQTSGKLIFASNSTSKYIRKAPTKHTNDVLPKNAMPNFQAFSGKKHYYNVDTR